MEKSKLPNPEKYIQEPLIISNDEFKNLSSGEEVTIKLTQRSNTNSSKNFAEGKEILLYNVENVGEDGELDPDPELRRLATITSVKPIGTNVHGDKQVEVTFHLAE